LTYRSKIAELGVDFIKDDSVVRIQRLAQIFNCEIIPGDFDAFVFESGHGDFNVGSSKK
jgi:hypothetical protein